jgi:hypothetical protein
LTGKRRAVTYPACTGRARGPGAAAGDLHFTFSFVPQPFHFHFPARQLDTGRLGVSSGCRRWFGQACVNQPPVRRSTSRSAPRSQAIMDLLSEKAAFDLGAEELFEHVRWESPLDASDTAAGIPFRKLRQGRPSVSFQTVTLLVVEQGTRGSLSTGHRCYNDCSFSAHTITGHGSKHATLTTRCQRRHCLPARPE